MKSAKRPKTPATPRNVHATWARNRWAYRARVTVDGKRVEGPLRRTVTEARQDRDVLLEHRHLQPERLLTLEEGKQLVLDELELKRSPPDTVLYYKWHFGVLIKHLGASTFLHDLTLARVEAFMGRRLNKDSVSPNTVNKHIQALHRILNLAVRRRCLIGNPIATISRPRNRSTESHWLTQAEVQEVLSAVLESGNPQAQRDHDVMAFLYLTGARITEAGRICARHIDLQNGLIRIVGKTAPREIPIGEELRVVLFRLLANKEPDDPVLPNKNTIQCFFQRWRERRKDPRLNARSLRHAFGSHLAHAGRTAHQIARLMGNSVRQANRYLHASGPQLRDAIAAVSICQAADSAPAPDRQERAQKA